MTDFPVLRLTDNDLEAALFALTDVVDRRRLCGLPIPSAVVALRQKLEIASACGTENCSEAEPLVNDLIDSDEAARILGCTPRWVTKIGSDLDGKQVAGGRWIFHRRAVIDYADVKHSR